MPRRPVTPLTRRAPHGCSNGRAAKALTEIGDPPIDWVSLAKVGWRPPTLPSAALRCPASPCAAACGPHPQGMGVPASRATTCEELAEQFAVALDREGPFLIEACL